MLCTAYHEQGIDAPYRPSHRNHPSSIWTRQSFDNFQWLIEHAYGISDEYTARYGKIHKSLEVLKWCEDHIHKLSFNSYDLTKFAIAISPDSICRTLPEFNEDDPVLCYRLYYFFDKAHLASWKNQDPPYWYNKGYFTSSDFCCNG